MPRKLAIASDRTNTGHAAPKAKPRKATANPFRDIVPVRSSVNSDIPEDQLRAAIREIMERCEPEKL